MIGEKFSKWERVLQYPRLCTKVSIILKAHGWVPLVGWLHALNSDLTPEREERRRGGGEKGRGRSVERTHMK